KMKTRLTFFTAVLLAGITLFTAFGAGNTAAANQPQGLTVSPAFQMITVPTGADRVPVVFTITNNRPVSQSLSLSVADFSSLKESGGLFFVGTNPGSIQRKYGLAKWVDLPDDSLTVPAKQT